MQRPRAGLVIPYSGGSGTPPASTRAGCEELADGEASMLHEKRGPETEIAAVKRRKARRRASFAGGPSDEGPACSQDRPRGAAFRTGAFRRSAPSRHKALIMQ